MDIQLYTMLKSNNSTKQPGPYSGNKGVTGEIKEGTGILSPHIRFTYFSGILVYNYAYIPAFSRYYFIDEWIWENGTVVAQMSADPMASFKTQIGQSSEYIIRSSNQSDGKIIDMMYPARGTTVLEENYNNFGWTISGGCYVVGTISGGANGRTGAVCYQIMSPGDFETFMQGLYGNVDWLDVDREEVSHELLKCLFNPIQYVSSCMWFPFVPTTSGLIQGVEFGWWKVPARSFAMPQNNYYADFIQIQIPKHPQADSRGEYLNLSPFTEYTLFTPKWGDITIDSRIVLNASALTVGIRVDMVTGESTLWLSLDADMNHAFLELDGQIGVAVEIAQITRDYAGMAGGASSVFGGLAGAAVGLATKNVSQAAGGAGQFLGGIASTVQSAAPQLNRRGSNGGRAAFLENFRLQGKFYQIVDEDNEHLGRPLFKKKRIDSVGGYLLIRDPEVVTSGTSAEQQMIYDYMTSGFYYE